MSGPGTTSHDVDFARLAAQSEREQAIFDGPSRAERVAEAAYHAQHARDIQALMAGLRRESAQAAQRARARRPIVIGNVAPAQQPFNWRAFGIGVGAGALFGLLLAALVKR